MGKLIVLLDFGNSSSFVRVIMTPGVTCIAILLACQRVAVAQDYFLRGASTTNSTPAVSSVAESLVQGESSNSTHEARVEQAQTEMQSAMNLTDNSSVSSSWFNWQHGIVGETCCMCSIRSGWSTLLYSAEDYSNWFGGHNARWRCEHECARKCESDWHHGRYFGCYDEAHLHELDNRYGHRSGFSIYYGHFGNIC